MKPYCFLVCVVLAASIKHAQAASEQQLNSIAVIGQLNGIALQCRYLEDVQRIKTALVRILPRKRELGIWFETKTNDSFLQFMQRDETCPAPDQFSARLDRAISLLEKAYQ